MDLPNKNFFNFNVYNVQEPDQPTIVWEREQVFLYKIMQAVNKKPEEDFLLIDTKTKGEIPLFKEIENSVPQQGVLLVFGKKPAELGLHIDIKPYQIVYFKSWQVLFAHSLAEISANINYKKQLWGQLKQLFP
jgi:hypothetical protein